MRKLLIAFLDIDGVLNSAQSIINNAGIEAIDPKALALLDKLVENTGVNIVITSTWRVGHSLYWLQQMFKTQGFHYPEKIIGATVNLPDTERCYEIDLWLQQVPVDAFVVLDDNGMGSLDHIEKNLVQTEFETGLLPEHIELAEQKLREQYNG